MNLWTEMKSALKVTVCAAVLLGLPTVLMLSCIDDIFFAKEVMPPTVEAVATVENAEIVTGVCTFGDCPVVTTAVVEDFSTTVNLAKWSQNLTTAEAAENKGSREDSAPETEATSQNAETTSQNETVKENATTEPETEPLTAEPVSETYTLTEEPTTEHAEPAAIYSASYFRQIGVIYWNGWRWTWYSERVLPGTGLNIPGRHTEGGYVRDADGYICLASDALSYGTVIATPFGAYGKVYDCGCDYDTIDVYVGW